MEKLAKRSKNEVVHLMAKEFIEQRLGMEAEPKHIEVFAQQISAFIQNYSKRFSQAS